MSKISLRKGDLLQEQREEWFDAFIHSITTDKEFIKMGIASDETKNLYDKLVFGDTTELFSEVREKSSQYFIKKLIINYLSEIKGMGISPLKLFLDHNDSQVLVWAEVKEDDEETEMSLYKAEAKANALNYQHGFHISSTILEKSDSIPVPPHYKDILTALNG